MSATAPFAKYTHRPWSVRTVLVRLSRRVTATYRLQAERRMSQLLAIMLAGISPLALALPGGAELVAGQATVSQPSADAMVVTQASNKAILNWQTFNIGAGQSVRFVQPGASSVALNRIVGNQASSIYGSLSANGQVFLVNPAGVIFAPGAQVNVGGLVASTLGISNENFMSGNYRFSGSGGAVENHGTITAARNAYVLLAGSQVSNTGSITADAGAVGLLAGSRVTVDTSGTGLVRFSVDAAAAQAAIANSGAITADGGQVAVLASAMGDAMATVINQSGVIRANTAVERNGMIVLSGGQSGVVRLSGSLTAAGKADGQSGGTIHVLGDKVALTGGAAIDASGVSGGGTVLVGGNYQGKGSEQNAARTHVAAGTMISADASANGDGGKVVVWADGDTRQLGTISARGGVAGGNGGFVEVSGKHLLDLQGSIDVAAPAGMGGKVLLDPQDILINTTTQAAPPNNPNSTPDVAFADAPDPGTYTIQVADVTGYSELFLQASRNITLASAMTMGAGNSVRLEAGNNITTNAGATLAVSGAGSIDLKADADSSGTGTLALGAALTAQTGGITLSGASVTSTSAGTIASTGAGNADAGQLTITSTGIVNLAGAITATGGTSGAGLPGHAGGSVNISGVGGVTTAGISASGSNGGTGNTAGGNAGNITVSNSGSGNLTTGALTARTGAAVGTGAGGNAGSINVNNTATGGNATTGIVTTTGGTKGDGGDITLSALGSVAAGNIASSGGTTITGNAGRNAGNVSITGAGINLGASTITASGSAGLGTSQTGGTGGAITLTSSAGITQTGAIVASGAAGSATGGSGGNAGSIAISNTVAGDISLGALTAATGAAVGAGTGGTAGSIVVTNSAAGASLGTGNISTAGGAGGNGGIVTLSSQAELATSGTINTSGTVLAAGTRTGSNAGNITITGTNRSVSGAITASGSAANGISQAGGNAGAVSITGAGTLNTAAITARSGAATAGGAGGSAGSITLTGSTVTMSGALTTSGGTNGAGGAVDITSQGALNVSGIAAAFGTGSTVRGDVTLLAGGPITQTGAIVARNLTATTADAAGSALTLNHAGNDTQNISLQVRDGTTSAVGTANVANAAISYTDSNGVVITGINNGTGVGGNVSLLAGGAITQTGVIKAATLTVTSANTTAGGAPITLTHVDNEAATVSLQARTGSAAAVGAANVATAIQYTNSGALDVSSINNGTGAGSNVTLLTGGALTQSGAIKAALLTATTTNTSPITLTHTGNDAATVNLQARTGTVATPGSVNAGTAIQYTDANAVGIAGINNGSGAGGDVTLVAGGAITQTGAIKANVLAAKTLSTTPAAITLTNAGNAAASIVLQTRNNADSDRTAASIAYTGANAVSIGGINAGSGSGASGNVILTSGGTITQTGALVAGGTTSLAAGAANNITLTDAGNDFTGAVSVISGLNVDLADSNALVLGASTVSGTLDISSAGTITQTGALNVAGTTTLAAGTANDITLNTATNNFSTVVIASGGDVSLRDSNALVVGAATVSNSLALTAGGNITQTGAINAPSLSAKTLLNAGAAITLDNAGNEVSTVDLRSRNAADSANAAGAIAYTDASALNIAAAQSTSTVTLIAGDAITQSGAITTGTLSATTRNNAGAAITLNNSANNAATINLQVLDLAGTANAAADIAYTDSNAVVISGINNGTGGGGNVTLVAGGAVTQSGAVNAGNLSATLTGAASSLTLTNAGNNIAQLATITTPGGFTLDNGNNAVNIGATIGTTNTGVSIASGTAATTFAAAGAIVSGGGNVVLSNTNAGKVLGNIDTTGGAATGNLTITGAGTISQQAGTSLKIKGATAIAAGAGNNVTLSETGNDFGGAVTLASGLNAAITDSNALVLGASTISGTLDLNADGAITQTGALIVTGDTTLAAGAANNITLNNAGNNFSTVMTTSGNNIVLRDSNALNIGTSTAGNSLALVAGGAITQTGAITAPSLSAKTLLTAGAAITLDNAANEVTTVDLRARNGTDTINAAGAISYRDASGFNIANAATTAALTLQANGDITQSGTVTAASLAVPDTGSGSLDLGTLANSIGTLNAITAAGGLALNNGNSNLIVAGNISTINNAVTIATGTGSYTQNANIDVTAGSGPITVTADTVAINTNAGNNALTTSGVLTLKARTAGRAMSLAGVSAFDLSLAELAAVATGATGPIVIGDAASSGVLTVGGAVALAGKTLTLNAGTITDIGVKTITAANVTLHANGQIGTSSANGIDIDATNLDINSGTNAFVRTGAINLGVGSNASSVGGTLDLSATGAVTQTASSGTISAATLRVKTLSAGTAGITLDNSGNNVNAINLQARNVADTAYAAGNIHYANTNAYDVAAVGTTGNATLSAGGAVTQSGAITAAGLALTGAGGNYTLRHAGNAVTTLAAATNSIDYSQINALSVGTVGVAGINTAGAAKVETTGIAADLTLNAAVSSSATGDAIILKAASSNAAGVSTGGQLINNVGATGISAASGRYLAYSGDPGATTEGVSGYSKRYNTAASHTPGGTDNMFLYRIAPTLTITTNNASRAYGQADPVFTGTESGYIDGDTAASVGVTRTTTAVFNTPVAAGPVTINSGATNSQNYALVLGNGTMSITKAAISSVSGITAANKTVDGNTNATLNTSAAVYNGSVAGDVLTVGTVTGNFNTPNIGNGKTVYLTGITLGGAAADNYTLLSDSGTTTASILTLHNLSAPAPTTRNTLRFETSDLRAADLDALLVKTAAAAKNSTGILVRTIRDPDEQQAGIVSIALSGETAYSHAGFQFSLPAGIFAQAGGDEEPIRISTFMGQPLPSWLHYDAVAKTFVAATVPAGALPLHVWVQGKKAAVMINISDM